MKRAASRIAVILALAALAAVPRAWAASYESGLQLVRANQWAKALQEFLPLAEQGHAKSQFSVALIYHLGRGVGVDLKKAYEWYKRSALQNYAPAINNIGMMYLNGEYVAQHRDVAFELFKKASDEHAQAKDNMAQCYENGWGVAKDAKRAIRYYREAGDDGYVLGWLHLAELYEQGRGVPKDIDKAVEWYIKAAKKNNVKAHDKLLKLGRLPPDLAK